MLDEIHFLGFREPFWNSKVISRIMYQTIDQSPFSSLSSMALRTIREMTLKFQKCVQNLRK